MNYSKTTWDKIVSGKELATAKSLRSKTYVVRKERTLVLPDLIDEGWVKYREYKNPKFVGVKRDKPVDEVFEDKVWMLFASMGFGYMNSDRHFAMSYDNKNPDFTQQIDVFAADEDTIIFVECKAAETMVDGRFKKPIEALHGQMDGLRREALARYPKRKVKFVWATHNYIMNKADMDKLNEWGIAYFSDAIVDYYTELTKHLGTSAKYQLLGNLFANQEIANMDECVPAIQGKMGGFAYYSFSIEPDRLLKIGYILHRNEANKNMMPTYQRLIKKKRLTEVQGFIKKGGYFPNSIIISIDTNGRGLRFDAASMRAERSISKLGLLHLPKRYRSAYIIDGQHRLYGYSDSPYAKTNSIPVVAFVDLDRQEQIKLFMDINENQKAVPKGLRVTLNADMLWESADYNQRREALRSKIAQMLGEENTSPLLGRVIVGEDEPTSMKCITVEAIQIALKRSNFFTQFGKKNVIVSDGTFDLGEDLEATCNLFYPFLEECLRYIKANSESEWAKGDTNSGILTMNRGMQALILVINDIVDMLVERKAIAPKTMATEEIFSEVQYYLDPLIDFFNGITADQRKDLRGYFGSGATPRFWRTFQKAVSDARNDFTPEKLQEYWADQAKTFNDESMRCLREIKADVKERIQKELERYYNENWLIKGLPRSVYSRAKEEADNQNYDVIASESGGPQVTIWECVTLAECKEVVTYGKNWSELFESVFTRSQDVKLAGGKEKKTEWITRLNAITNKLAKASYSVPTEEYTFIKEVYDWIKSM